MACKPCLAWCTARVRSHKRRPLLQWDWCALLTTVHCLTYFFTNAFSLVFRKTLGTPSSILTKRSRSRKNYLTFHTRNSNHCKRRTSYAVGWIYLILKQPFRNYKWKYKSAKNRWHRWKSWTTWDWKESWAFPATITFLLRSNCVTRDSASPFSKLLYSCVLAKDC